MVGLLFIQHQLFGGDALFVSDEHGAQLVFMVSKINLSPFFTFFF